MELGKKTIEGLDQMDPKARVEAIDDLIHHLQFEKRVTLLTEEQRDHMQCDVPAVARQRIDDAKNPTEKERLISDWARTLYFRQCAWVTYLNDGGDPPIGKSLDTKDVNMDKMTCSCYRASGESSREEREPQASISPK